MRRRKKIRVVGVVQRRDTGRPEVVYGRRCKAEDIEHEVMVAEAEILLGSRIERGAKVGKTEADGMLVRDGQRCFIEVDNSGKMTARQMQAKWKRYEGVEGDILVIATSEGRMQRLRAGGELVKSVALFTTFDRLRSVAEPWIDWHGKTVGI